MLKAVIILVFVACASAMVCLPETCQTVRCASTENCAGTVKQNGGFCGCCDLCVTELAMEDKCMPNIFLGIPQPSQCGNGMYCDPSTHTCKSLPIIVRDTPTVFWGQPVLYTLRQRCPKRLKALDLTSVYGDGGCPTLNRSGPQACPCAQKLAEVEATLAASQHNLLGLEKPHCDTTTGNYLPMQFAGSQAFCVTEDGTSISGYMVNRWETGPDMNCQCAREQYAYMKTGLIGKMFQCEANGNYANIGCTGSVCYCQDKYGKQVGTSTVSIGQMSSMNC